MKLVFWLLDINPKIDDDKVELWLWGIDAQGNRVLIVDRNFTAYFYAVLPGGVDAAKVAEEIMRSYASQLVKAEVVSPSLLWQTRNCNKGLLQSCNRNRQTCQATSKHRRSIRLPRRRHSRRHALPNRQQRGSLQLA